jgi:uncharacterized delta-60 repeat protein
MKKDSSASSMTISTGSRRIAWAAALLGVFLACSPIQGLAAKGKSPTCTAPTADLTTAFNCYSSAGGCLDSNFGNPNGYVLTDADDGKPSVNDFGKTQDIVFQPVTGNIYAVGEFYGSGTAEQVTLLRYTPAGVLDITFGCNPLTYLNSSCPGVAAGINFPGVVKVPLPYNQTISVAALQPDGKILAAGQTSLPSGSAVLVVRFNPTGSLDGTFGTGGIVEIATTTSTKTVHGKVVTSTLGFAIDMALQSDGKIVIVGGGVVRLNTDGTPDVNFGTSGISPGVGYAIALQTVGTEQRILVGGGSLLYRLTSSGTLDTTFGPSMTGQVVTESCGGRDNISGLALDSDGRIIVGGSVSVGTTDNFAVTRYSADGTLDTSFGGFNAPRGLSIVSPFGGDTENSPKGLVQEADGTIVLMGTANDPAGDSRFALVGFTQYGLPDNAFGTGGAVVPEIGTNTQYEVGFRARIDGNGKIVMGGAVEPSTTVYNAVARFWP